jgi:hypothetical protein
MKQFLQNKYPELLNEGKLCVDSFAMEKIIKHPHSIGNYVAFKYEVPSRKWDHFATAVYGAFAVRNKDFCAPSHNSEESLQRQIAVIDDYFRTWRQDDESAHVIDCADSTLLQYDANYKLKHFTIHVLDGRPCLEMSFAIPIGHVEDIPIIWIGQIPSVIVLDEKLYVMVCKIRSPADGDDFELYRNTSELIGYHWAYQQIACARVDGTLIDIVRVHDMGFEDEHIEFNREFMFYDQKQLVEWQDNVVTLIGNFLNSAKGL